MKQDEQESAPWLVEHRRRTHSVHNTPEDARRAAYDLGRLMNGVPFGYVFAVQERMGKFAFISYRGAA